MCIHGLRNHERTKQKRTPFGDVRGIPKRKSGFRRYDTPQALHFGNQTELFNRIVTQIEETTIDTASISLKESLAGQELGWDTKTSVDRRGPGEPAGKRSTEGYGFVRMQSRPFHFKIFSPKRENPVKTLTINWLQPANPISPGVAMSGGPSNGPCQRAPRPGLTYSLGIRDFHEQRSANCRRKPVVRRMLISPASIFWRLRVAISAFSANCSCVMPLRTRCRRTFAPKARILDHSFLLRGTTYYIAGVEK